MVFLSPNGARQATSLIGPSGIQIEGVHGLDELAHLVPLYDQEPVRRDFGKWQPTAGDFVTDLRGAQAGGAAGWCFHNGAGKDGQPRRSFDLRSKRLFEQLDEVETRALDLLSKAFHEADQNREAKPTAGPL